MITPKRSSYKVALKIISVVLLMSCSLTFSMGDLAFGQVFNTPVNLSTARSLSTLPPFIPPPQVDIAKNIAVVNDFFNSSNQKAPQLFIIQDAHQSLDAQKNINKLINKLVDEQKVEMVLFEGGSEPLDKTVYRFIEEDKRNLKIYDQLFKTGMLGGIEKAALSLEKNIPFIGIENPENYYENLEKLTLLYQSVEDCELELKSTEKYFKLKKGKLIQGPLKKVISNKEKFQNQHQDLNRYLKNIISLSKEHLDVNFLDVKWQSSYPQLVRYQNMVDLDSIVKTHEEQVRRELHVIKSRTENVPYLESFSFLWDPEKHWKAQGHLRWYFESFIKLINERDEILSEELRSWMGYQILKDELSSVNLFNEIKTIENQILKSLQVSNEVMSFLEEFYEYEQFKKLIHMNITHREWSEIQHEQFSFVQSDKLKTLLNLAKENYRVVEKRDQDFSRHIQQRVNGSGVKRAVVVTGGFHTKALTDFLKEINLSYVVFAPSIKNIQQKTDYQKRILLASSKIDFPGSKTQVMAPIVGANPGARFSVYHDRLQEAAEQVSNKLVFSSLEKVDGKALGDAGKTKYREVFVATNQEKETEVPFYQEKLDAILDQISINGYFLIVFLMSLIPTLSFIFSTNWGASSPVLAFLTHAVFFFLNFNIIETMFLSLYSRKTVRLLPEKNFENGIPEEEKTVVFFPILAKSESDLDFIEENVMASMKLNNSPNVHWIVLSGSSDEIAELEQSRVRNLQERFGRNKIIFMRREPSQNNWEKKRGGYMHLMHWLKQGMNPEGTITEDPNFPAMPAGKVFGLIDGELEGLKGFKGKGVKNFLVGDSDTIWARDSVEKLVSKIAHPDNEEYGIFQGRVRLYNKNDTYLTRLYDYTYRLFGRHIYAQWNALKQVNYIGHGTGWNIEIFLNRIAGKMNDGYPSHDIVESYFVKTALVADVVSYEESPSDVVLIVKQLERWWKGNKVAAKLFLPKIPNESGEMVKNDSSLAHKYLIFDAERNYMAAPAVVLLLIISTLGYMGLMNAQFHLIGITFLAAIFIKMFAPWFLDNHSWDQFKKSMFSLVFINTMGPFIMFQVTRMVVEEYLKDLLSYFQSKKQKESFDWVPQGSLKNFETFQEMYDQIWKIHILAILGLITAFNVSQYVDIFVWYNLIALILSPIVVWFSSRAPPGWFVSKEINEDLVPKVLIENENYKHFVRIVYGSKYKKPVDIEKLNGRVIEEVKNRQFELKNEETKKNKDFEMGAASLGNKMEQPPLYLMSGMVVAAIAGIVVLLIPETGVSLSSQLRKSYVPAAIMSGASPGEQSVEIDDPNLSGQGQRNSDSNQTDSNTQQSDNQNQPNHDNPRRRNPESRDVPPVVNNPEEDTVTNDNRTEQNESGMTREQIRSQFELRGLLNNMNFSPGVTEGDLNYWFSRNLSNQDLMWELESWKKVRELAEATGFRLRTQGDISYWRERYQNGELTEEEVRSEFTRRAAGRDDYEQSEQQQVASGHEVLPEEIEHVRSFAIIYGLVDQIDGFWSIDEYYYPEMNDDDLSYWAEQSLSDVQIRNRFAFRQRVGQLAREHQVLIPTQGIMSYLADLLVGANGAQPISEQDLIGLLLNVKASGGFQQQVQQVEQIRSNALSKEGVRRIAESQGLYLESIYVPQFNLTILDSLYEANNTLTGSEWGWFLFSFRTVKELAVEESVWIREFSTYQTFAQQFRQSGDREALRISIQANSLGNSDVISGYGVPLKIISWVNKKVTRNIISIDLQQYFPWVYRQLVNDIEQKNGSNLSKILEVLSSDSKFRALLSYLTKDESGLVVSHQINPKAVALQLMGHTALVITSEDEEYKNKLEQYLEELIQKGQLKEGDVKKRFAHVYLPEAGFDNQESFYEALLRNKSVKTLNGKRSITSIATRAGIKGQLHIQDRLVWMASEEQINDVIDQLALAFGKALTDIIPNENNRDENEQAFLDMLKLSVANWLSLDPQFLINKGYIEFKDDRFIITQNFISAFIEDKLLQLEASRLISQMA